MGGGRVFVAFGGCRSVLTRARSRNLRVWFVWGLLMWFEGFTPYVVRDPGSEQDVLDFLLSAAEAGDVDAELLLGLLKVMSLNDLIVEGAIRIQRG